MTMMILGIFFNVVIFMMWFFDFFKMSTRFNFLKKEIVKLVLGIINMDFMKILLGFLFLLLCVINLLGNIPLNFIPTMFYSFTLTFSLLFWVSIMICVSITQLKEFLSHMLPYGSPVGLMLVLPLIEIFSQIIRPFTLMIRLSTNLAAGHIMVYMFSYFTLLSSLLAPFIYVVVMILFVLELCISLLQAYIFVSLMLLYIDETVEI